MNQPLDRRTFLRTSGVALALPLLEAMSPALARAAIAAPRRMVTVCNALGLHPPSLFPATPGPDYETTEYLELLQDHRRDYTLFSGLSHHDQNGRQAHSSEVSWLTGARHPELAGFRNTISVDQFAAGELGYVTRFPSLVLGTDTTVQRSAKGTQSQSFTRRGVMVPSETSPANLFARMFLAGNADEVERQKRDLGDGRSILDGLGSQRKTLDRRASAVDRGRLDSYFEAVRAAEKGITEARAWLDRPKPQVDREPPVDVQERRDLIGRVQLLMDLIPLILQTDSTRVVAVMIQELREVPKIPGVSGTHHNLSHHGQDPDKIAQLRKVEREIVKCFGSLLEQLKGASEGDGTLLDRTAVLFGSNLGNGNSHDTRNLPIFLAGGGFEHGRYVAFDQDDNAPLSNLYVTMLNHMELETGSFGQSTGELSW